MLTQINGDGTMTAICDGCGATMTLQEPHKGPLYDWLLDMAHAVKCAACVERDKAVEKEAANEQRRREIEASLAMRLRRMGVPDGMLTLSKAPNAALGAWIWERRRKSLVIGGLSGVGKTTAAVAALHCLAARRELNARYVTLATLGAEYVEALRGDRGGQETFWWRLSKLHVLVIDEMIGRGGYGKFSPAVQELISGLVDRVYMGAFDGAVWLLGNFHRGSWAEAFDEPRAVVRRLQEKFDAVWVETSCVREMKI